ncbi:MAG: prolyl oligopeptidase family serine peptidase [Bryobacteraceae bacterium]|jgi:dienelactone hydrolase
MLSRLICFASALPLMAQTAAAPGDTARKALDLLLGGKYAEFSAMLAPQFKAATTEDGFGKLAAQVKSWGAVGKIGDPAVQDMGVNAVVTIPVSFATQTINFQFGVNSGTGLVSAMLMRPGATSWQRPDYSDPKAFREREVSFGEGENKLPGLLTVPASGPGPFPAALLVQGFGPKDKDDTSLAVKPARDLAEGLATRGILTMRYEKRTKQYFQRMQGKPYTADDETVNDALAALEFLRRQPGVDAHRVFLLGHDLGGYLAPRIATDDGKLTGLIMLAANASPLEDIMIYELASVGVSQKNIDAAKLQAARVKKLETADADAPPVMGLPAEYWLDLKGYNPVEVAGKLNIPILVIHGGRDFQVPPQDFTLWQEGLGEHRNVTLHNFPALDHQMVAGEGKSTEADYKKPGHVAAEVIDEIAKFIVR